MIELRDALQVLAADRLSRDDRLRRRFARDHAALSLFVARCMGVVGAVAIVALLLAVLVGGA